MLALRISPASARKRCPISACLTAVTSDRTLTAAATRPSPSNSGVAMIRIQRAVPASRSTLRTVIGPGSSPAKARRPGSSWGSTRRPSSWKTSHCCVHAPGSMLSTASVEGAPSTSAIASLT